MVLRIKQLVFDEGLTLSGARRRLEEEGESRAPSVMVEDMLDGRVRDSLRQVRTGLKSILELLAHSDHPPELRLVASSPGKKKPSLKAKSKK